MLYPAELPDPFQGAKLTLYIESYKPLQILLQTFHQNPITTPTHHTLNLTKTVRTWRTMSKLPLRPTVTQNPCIGDALICETPSKGTRLYLGTANTTHQTNVGDVEPNHIPVIGFNHHITKTYGHGVPCHPP